MKEIEPTDLKASLESKAPLCLIDVREPDEYELVHIPGSVLIPMMQVEESLEEIQKLSEKGSLEIICYCHHGQRSAMVVDWLLAQGMQNVQNLRGGIDAYAKEADTTLACY